MQDVADHNLPLMYWYAAEPWRRSMRVAGELASSSRIALVQRFHGAVDRVAGHTGIDALFLLRS